VPLCYLAILWLGGTLKKDVCKSRAPQVVQDEFSSVDRCPRRSAHLTSRQVMKESLGLSSKDPRQQNWYIDPYSGLVVRGDSGEEAYLWRQFFWRKGGGIVFEMGGHDGYTKSISMSLEQSLGWKAYLVEPGPRNFHAMQQNRPLATNFNAAVCKEQKTLHFVELDTVGGIMEFMPTGFIREFFPNDWISESGEKQWQLIEASPDFTPVQCLPLSVLLRVAGLCHIDLFILDVQGAELDVLRSFDFLRTSVDVWAIEVEHKDEDEREIRALLGDNGYQFHSKQANNLWFHRKDFQPSSSLDV